MKEQEIDLTLQETEQLCSLYMDCRLSVLEETELQYILSKVSYHSPLIDDVRKLMDIELHYAEKVSVNTGVNTVKDIKRWFRGRMKFISIAASLTVLFSIGVSFFRDSSKDPATGETYYVAYVDGHCLNDEVAQLRIEEEKRSVDEFIMEMAELEARNQQIIDNLLNH